MVSRFSHQATQWTRPCSLAGVTLLWLCNLDSSVSKALCCLFVVWGNALIPEPWIVLWGLCVCCGSFTNLRHALGFTRLAWLIEVYSVAHKEHNSCDNYDGKVCWQIMLEQKHVFIMYNYNNLLRWETSLTCVICVRCRQTRRRRLRRRTTWVSLRPRRWTPPTWRPPSTIFSQVTPGFSYKALPSLSSPSLWLKNTIDFAVGGY